MSHWVTLEDENGKSVSVERHEGGGTYCVGGITEAELNVTYNYGPLYYKFLDSEKGLRFLDSKRAKDVIDKLQKAVDELGTNKYERDYWAPTMGNAGYALNILLQWAKANPEAIFKVS